MSTNTKFFEEDYVNNFNPKSKVILEELDSAQELPKPPEFRLSIVSSACSTEGK